MPVLIHIPLSTLATKAKGAARFDLDEVLDAIRPWGESLSWSIFDLWALARGEVFLAHRGLARRVELVGMVLDPACGDIAAPLSFTQLLAFAACTSQIVDGLFVGVDDGRTAAVLPGVGSWTYGESLLPEDDWYRAYPIVLYAFDSAHWRIYVRDDAAAAALMRRFPQAAEHARW